ncbi:MAG: oligosaccharide flippase family protein [Clostridia bacterium]|nr:oligosaccharide flippase family protein [Clostridia bacterium]
MENDFNKKCSALFTVARAFALISIVCAHITFRTEYSPIIGRVFSIVASVGVIAYLFMSGYYYNTKKFKSFFAMLKAKAVSVVIPWMFLGTVIYLYNSLLGGLAITPLEWFKWIIGYKTYLYFMTVLLLCFMIFYRTNKAILISAIPISLISLMATATGVLDSVVELLHITHYLNIFNWIGIFALGKLISQIEAEKVYKFIRKSRYAVIAIFVLAVVALCVFDGIEVGYFTYIGIYLELLGALFIFAVSSFKIFNLKLIQNIANNSFAIYLIHMAVIGVSGRIINIHPITQIFSSVFIILVCHFALELCRFVIKKLKAEKYLNPLFGFRSRKIVESEKAQQGVAADFLKNKTVKNAGWLIGGKIAQMLISFVVGILTARYLGPSNYGLIGYAGAYTAFFTAFCTLGTNSILVKEFVETPEKDGTILGTTLLLRMASSIMSAITIISIVFFVDAGEPTTIAVVALCSVGAVFHVFEVFHYWFQSKLMSKVTAMATFIAYVVTSAYKVILMVLGKNVMWFAFATSVDYICIALFLYIAYRKNGGGKLKFSWECGKRILKQSHHFILTGIMVAIYGQTDKLMLKQMINETEVGLYSTAVAICGMWVFLLSAVIDSVYPSIMQANGKDEELFKKRNRQLYAFVFYLSMFVSLMFQIFAPLVIKILYGEQYMGAVAPLRIVTWYTAFSYLGVARNAWIVCKGAQKYLKYIYFGSALANVVFNLMLIPHLGASGAAIASLVAQISTIVLPLFIKPLRENTLLMLEGIMLKGIDIKGLLLRKKRGD